MLALACVLTAGCARIDQTVATPAPEPGNPDLTPVIERFYGLIEAGHRGIAYTMLSPAYQRKLDRGAFDARYRELDFADIKARQSGDHAVVARIGVPARGSHPVRALRERVTFRWNGDAWTIDAIERTETSPPRAN